MSPRGPSCLTCAGPHIRPPAAQPCRRVGLAFHMPSRRGYPLPSQVQNSYTGPAARLKGLRDLARGITSREISRRGCLHSKGHHGRSFRPTDSFSFSHVTFDNMIVRVFFTAALFIRLVTPVAAVPPIFHRDVSCVATRTITVTATVTGASPPASDLSASSPVPQPAAAVSTTGVVASSPANLNNGGSGVSASNVNNGGGPGATAAGPGVQTVTIISTVTVLSTVQPSAGPNSGQQFTGSKSAPKPYIPANNGGQPSVPDSGNSGPVTVTVTVTSNSVIVSTVVQTQTVYQNYTIIQTQTAVETVTQTVAAAVTGDSNAQQSGDASPETIVRTLTSLLLFPTRPASQQFPGPSGSPPQPSVQPYYTNGTQSGHFSNSSNASFPALSSLRPPIPFLPSAATTAAPWASPTPVASYSNSSSSSPNTTHFSGGYQNSLYFANWYASKPYRM